MTGPETASPETASPEAASPETGSPAQDTPSAGPDASVLAQDALVEEVSIDGMCGVY